MMNYVLLGIAIMLLAVNIAITVWLIRIIIDKFEESMNAINKLAHDTYNGLDWIYDKLPKPRAKKSTKKETEEKTDKE